MDLSEAEIDQLKKDGLGVVRLFGYDEKTSLFIGFSIACSIVVLMLLYSLTYEKQKPKQQKQKEDNGKKEKKNNGKSKNNKKKNNNNNNNNEKRKIRIDDNDREDLVTVIKDHGSKNKVTYIAFSNNGKYLASASNDRTLRLFYTDNIQEKFHRHQRINTQYDHSFYFKWTNDDKYLVLGMANGKNIAVYRVADQRNSNKSKKTKLEKEFPESNTKELLNIDVSSNNYFLGCSGSDTLVNVWNTKLEVVETIKTNLLKNNSAHFSPDNKFISIATRTQNGRIYEINYDKAGNISSIKQALSLANSSNAHKKQVYDILFLNDSKRILSISADGNWKIWNIDVQYSKGADAICENTFTADNLDSCDKVSLSKDNKYVAISSGSSFFVFSIDGKLIKECEEAHEVNINAISIAPNNKTVATCGDDGLIKVWLLQ